MGDPLESLARGAGQGATFGFGDEAIAKILARLDGPADPEGYDRNYAAGSAEQDYLQGERGSNAAAAAAHPWLFRAGAVAGAAPAAIAGSAAASGALGGAGLAARAAGQAGVGAAQGAVSGAGEGHDSETRLKGAGLGAALGGALGGLAEAAPAGVKAAKGLWARLNEPAAQPALAMAKAMPSARPTRYADVPARGSIPPEAVPAIPKHDRPLVSESMLPTADDMADAAYESVGQKKLLEHGVGEGVQPEVGQRYAANAMLMDHAYPPPPKPRAPTPEPTTGVRTVRPPRGKRAAPPPGPKLPSEVGAKPMGEQSALEFPAEKPDTQHWLEGELGKPASETPMRGDGINPSRLADFGEGRKAVLKRSKGALAMPELGISAQSLPYREQAAHDVGQRMFGADNPVPKTVAKQLEDGPASLQEFVPDTEPAFAFEDPITVAADDAHTVGTVRGEDLSSAPQDYVSRAGPERTAEVAAAGYEPSHQRTFALDSVNGQIDRHGKNLLRKGDGSAVAIDNGYAFGRGPKGFVPPAVPYQQKQYLANVEDFLPEIQQQIKGTSLKGVAKDLRQSGELKRGQVSNTLGRLRDLQSNPQQLKGLDESGWDDWVRQDFTKRNLPTADVMEIEGRSGGIPSKHAPNSWFEGNKPLPGKALEGEQLAIPGTDPKYWYHNTPTENLPAIAKEGLVPGKPSAHHPNPQDRTFFAGEGDVDEWAKDLARYKGGAPMTKLRTTAPAQARDGSVRVPQPNELGSRFAPTAPERLEAQDADGTWKSLTDLLGKLR